MFIKRASKVLQEGSFVCLFVKNKQDLTDVSLLFEEYGGVYCK